MWHIVGPCVTSFFHDGSLFYTSPFILALKMSEEGAGPGVWKGEWNARMRECKNAGMQRPECGNA